MSIPHDPGHDGTGGKRRSQLDGFVSRAFREARLRIAALTLIASLVLGCGAGLLFLASSLSPSTEDATGSTELGKSIYLTHCAGCHGAELKGQPDWRQRRPDGRLPAPPHDASGHTWHHSDQQLFTITKRGVAVVVPGYQSDMPGFEGVLSDREIWAVLAYIKGTWPPEIRARHARSGETGK